METKALDKPTDLAGVLAGHEVAQMAIAEAADPELACNDGFEQSEITILKQIPSGSLGGP